MSMKELQIKIWEHYDKVGYVNAYQPVKGGWMASAEERWAREGYKPDGNWEKWNDWSDNHN